MVTLTTNTTVAEVPRVIWDNLTTAGDPGAAFKLVGGKAVRLSVQFIGTFGSGTAIMQGSNDGTNWVTLKDITNTAVSTTAAALFEIETSAAYVRPDTSGGTADDLDVIMVIRDL